MNFFKKYFLPFFFIISYSSCSSQETIILSTEDNAKGNIYKFSMEAFLDNLEKTIEDLKHEDSVNYKEIKEYFNKLYILKTDFTSGSLIKIRNSRIIFLDNEEQMKNIISRNGMQKLLRVIPLRKNEKYFFVNILLFHCTMNNNDLVLANASGTSVNFKFDSKSNRFIYIKGDSNN